MGSPAASGEGWSPERRRDPRVGTCGPTCPPAGSGEDGAGEQTRGRLGSLSCEQRRSWENLCGGGLPRPLSPTPSPPAAPQLHPLPRTTNLSDCSEFREPLRQIMEPEEGAWEPLICSQVRSTGDTLGPVTGVRSGRRLVGPSLHRGACANSDSQRRWSGPSVGGSENRWVSEKAPGGCERKATGKRRLLCLWVTRAERWSSRVGEGARGAVLPPAPRYRGSCCTCCWPGTGLGANPPPQRVRKLDTPARETAFLAPLEHIPLTRRRIARVGFSERATSISPDEKHLYSVKPQSDCVWVIYERLSLALMTRGEK